MDWLRRLNEAITYIEDNLGGTIDYAQAAQKACCSAYHFQRMFSYMAEVPLSEYIRNRRLSRAAVDLQNGGDKVINVAVKYGYDSPTAFTRAFQAFHGVTPTAAREKGVTLKAYPAIAFQVQIKGASVMDYKLVDKEAFRIVGYKLPTSMENGNCYAQIPQFWNETASSGGIARLGPLIDGEPHGMLGVSVCCEPMTETSRFDYYIAAPTSQPVPEGMEAFTVPAATWAVFTCVGPMPGAIQEMQKRIATEWLPTSGYEFGNAPDIEAYFDEDGTKPDVRSEIWVPVVKKA